MDKDENGDPAAYLGDGVYAVMVGVVKALRLTTQSHKLEEADNIIYLDKQVYETLVRAARQMGWEPPTC